MLEEQTIHNMTMKGILTNITGRMLSLKTLKFISEKLFLMRRKLVLK